MSSAPESRRLRWILWSYRVLLRAMPGSFRRSYGPASIADLRRILEGAADKSGIAVARLAVGALLDLLMRLPREWWTVARRTSRRDERTVDTRQRMGRGERMMRMLQELRLAARTLSKKPGFTAVVVTTLGLGIGANVAIFSIIDAVLLQPLAYEDSERIVQMQHHAPGLGFDELGNSPGMLAFYEQNIDVFEATAAFNRSRSNLSGGAEAVRVPEVRVSPEIFTVLRIRPFIGRPFNADDAQPGAARVALLEHGLWRARFGADPAVVGRTIELDGETVEVVGVMPEGFAFPDDDVGVYTPLYVDPDGPFGTFGLSAISRLAPDVSVEVAELRTVESLARLSEFFPDLSESFIEESGFSVTVRTLRDRMVTDVESILWIIMGTVAFVLLIACANVANLFLVRAESRQKEMAVRAAMGAGRSRIATSFLSESVILGLGGGLIGVAIAGLGIPALLSLGELPREANVTMGFSSLALAAALSLVVGLTFGAIPLARYAGGRFAQILRDGSRGSTSGRERHRARNVLVATQLALGLVLLVGSGLMLRSFAELRAVDLGIDSDDVLTLALNRNAGEDPDVAARFFQEAADRIGSLPGVATVGITTSIPLGGGNNNGGSFYIESRPREEGTLPPTAMYRAVDHGYFESMDIPLVSGRPMERADWEEARPVVWVNETFERTHLGGDAVGERIGWGVEDGEDLSDFPWAEVVGVIADVREFGIADEDMRPNAYFPLRPGGGAEIGIESVYLTIEMEDGQDPAALASSAQREIRSLDRQVPITATRTMDDIVAEEIEEVSATMIILAAATGMALFLGAIGLAGVISYVVGQRTREIGVRVALGATGADVRRMILRQSLTVTIVGSVLGLLGAFWLTRLLDALLFEISPTDPVTFTLAPMLLVAISLAATWLPVRRAVRLDPTEALRAD